MIENPSVKILCAIVALVMWAQVADTVIVEEIVELPIELGALPDSLIVRSQALPKTARVRVRSSKLDFLIGDLLRRDAGVVRIQISDAKAGNTRHELTVADVRSRATALSVLSPREAVLEVHRSRSRTLPIRFALEGQIPSGSILAGRPELSPAEVVVSGPAFIVDALHHVNTVPFDVSRSHESFRQRLRLEFPDADVSLSPLETEVSVGIDRIVEKTFSGVEVSILSDLERATVHVDPTSAQIRVTGAESALAGMTGADVSVLLHIGALEAGVYELPAEVVVPEGIGTSLVEPLVFRVIIEAGAEG